MTIRFRALALVATLGLAASCAEPFDTGAQRSTVDVPLEAWAMTGSPPSYPTAFLVPQATVVRADAAGSFDLAFDIDPSGRLVVLPVSHVVMPLTGARRIGLLRSTEAYNTIIEAPLTGWAYDSTITVNPGGAFLVRVQTQFCQFDIRQDIYAKFFVDSVLPAERRVKLTARINPNCGFRSLLIGIPAF